MLLNSPSAFVQTRRITSVDPSDRTQNVFLANSMGQIIELRFKTDG
jgi:hypothetical protein